MFSSGLQKMDADTLKQNSLKIIKGRFDYFEIVFFYENLRKFSKNILNVYLSK